MAEEVEPLRWVDRLEERLKDQRKHAQLYDSYYSNDRELQIIVEEYRQVFGVDPGQTAFFEPPRTNVSAVGVNAVAERLDVEGFRVGTDDNQAGADAADALWLRNDLDVMSAIAHVESLAKSTAFALVWPGDDNRAVVSIEDPEQMVIARRQVPPYDVVAALKVYADEWTGEDLAVLYRPEGLYKFRAASSAAPEAAERIVIPSGVVIPSRWRIREEAPDLVPAPEAFKGRVPVVEIANRARLIRPPVSELVDVAPLADSHSKVLADLVIACSFGAVPIRTATGITLPRDKNTGEPYSPFDVRADRAMISENPAAKFGTLPAADLAGYVEALDMILLNVRIVTRAPLHYYGGGTSSGISGETLKASEASLVRKVTGTQPRVGLGWRQMTSLGLAIDTPEFADAPVTVRWGDPETRIEAQDVDAAGKYNDMGVPLEIILERVGFDRATIRRAMDLRSKEKLRAEAILAAIQRDADLGAGDADTVPAEEVLV